MVHAVLGPLLTYLGGQVVGRILDTLQDMAKGTLTSSQPVSDTDVKAQLAELRKQIEDVKSLQRQQTLELTKVIRLIAFRAQLALWLSVGAGVLSVGVTVLILIQH